MTETQLLGFLYNEDMKSLLGHVQVFAPGLGYTSGSRKQSRRSTPVPRGSLVAVLTPAPSVGDADGTGQVWQWQCHHGKDEVALFLVVSF